MRTSFPGIQVNAKRENSNGIVRLFGILFYLAYNADRLGEGKEIELRQPTLVLELNKDIKFRLCSPTLMWPSRRCAFTFYFKMNFALIFDITLIFSNSILGSSL